MNSSSHHKLSQPLHDWLHSLPHTLPLRATTCSPMYQDKRLEYWIAESNLPADSLVTAMLWLRQGVIDPTHAIVQNGKSPLASYLHGVVHRLEGDYWNSKYWFRQVRDIRLLRSLSLSMEQLLQDEGLSLLAVSLSIMKGNEFDPSALVTAVEHLGQTPTRDSNDVRNLEVISWIEWTALWGIV